ncbi:LysR family transcriptional regulator [Streptomyces sp. H39-C1]|uniref:LysR family transcriptional regulator n=1 Tax=Streptomyces sp. H39-C1 TaxID=3004355 RepID=UPI0022AEE5CC|nr:LysR family transcriptional regulator [Streptomyces sp. H39-C1]MCZ4103023.1 LysR family transcriptional regulator [Streptomyces sp. H39-C1]
MQLGWLQTFIAVYNSGSFTKAAQRLGISQPAVTQHIRGLEGKLGQPLFVRTPQGAEPTPEGETLANETKEAISDLDRTIARRLGTGEGGGPMRIGGPASFMSERILPAVGTLIGQGMDIGVTIDSSGNLLEDLKGGSLDMAVSAIQPRCREIESTPLADEDLLLVASPEIADSLPRGILQIDGVRALEKLPMISFGNSESITKNYWMTVFDTPPPVDPALVVSDLRAVLKATLSSIGISVLPAYLCAEAIAQGNLVVLMHPEVPPIVTFHLAVRSGALANPTLERLQGHLVAASREW